MRRALATATIAGAVALIPFTAVSAAADEAPLAAGSVLTQSDSEDVDEPLEKDGDDDTGKYGLVGLTGLFGLFGYKKYRDSRGTTQSTTTTVAPRVDGSSPRV